MVYEYVSRLRGVFGDASLIVTRAPGYTVERDACDLDAADFADLLHSPDVATARRLAGRGRRTAVLRSAYNDSHLDNPHVNAQLNAANRKSGLARAFAYARVDHALVRDVAPAIAFPNESEHDVFSARIGCQLYQPVNGMDLGALCIRTGRDAADPKRSVP